MLQGCLVNSFFPCTARLWNCLPNRMLSSDLRCKWLTSFNCMFFLKRFLVCFNLFVLLFLVTSCLIVAVQSCMEWIPILKKHISICDASETSVYVPNFTFRQFQWLVCILLVLNVLFLLNDIVLVLGLKVVIMVKTILFKFVIKLIYTSSI